MGQPIVHVEIIGSAPATLRAYYGQLFGWEFDTSAPVAPEVSVPADYGFTDGNGDGPPAGVGGGAAFTAHTLVYIGVTDVGAALAHAEQLGGTRVLGPVRNPGKGIVVGQFRDPAGNLVGVAGPK